ncbi:MULTISPECIES: hypothetical protein [Haloferax]|uniref:Right-handed parallel beta-helix repeat-containing protein n=2 Tax=Haloferax TaxID=2251 RepID=A0A6G1Z6S6_9EURY|nr:MULTISPECIES: hypothetical protein [Haloferax]KAB1185159.1 hypothetical protein Hfx1149_16715 [Haloferax sp. CBA1149]MRW82337.1 hypothetical protein [Haloferax marinisediminis]
MAGVALGSVGATSAVVENASAAQSVRGITFDRVLNAADFCDTTGQRDCSSAIESRLTDGTLIKFPKGTYKIANDIYPGGPSNVGLYSEEGAVFKIPSNQHVTVFLNKGGRNVLFEGIDIDQTADGAFGNMKILCRDNAQIRNVEVIGRAPNADERLDQHILADVYDSDGTSIIQNFKAAYGGYLGAYRNSAGGIQATPGHHGTLKIIDCHLEEMANNGIYATRNDGNIQVEGGIYRNNDVAQVRLMGPNSYVRDALIEIDMSKSNNPGTPRKMRGIWIETKQSKFSGTKNGAYIENCTIIVRDSPNSIEGVDLDETGGWLEVNDCYFVIDRNNTRAITAYRPEDKASNYPKAPRPWDLKVTNCSITGSAANRESIKIIGRPDSVIENTCIQQTNTDRDGVTVVNASDCFVGNSTINVDGQEVREVDTNVQTTSISTSGSCPLPGDSSNDSTSDSTDDSTDSTDSTDSSSGSVSDTASTLEVISTEDPSELTYEFTTSGEISKIFDDTRNSAEENNDDVSQNSDGTWSVQGYTGNGYGDSYAFEGELLEFSPATGPVKLVVDGQEVDPTTLDDSTDSTSGSTDSTTDSTSDSTDSTSDSTSDTTTTHEIVIDGEGRSELTNYEFTVSGSVEQTDDPGEDNVSDTTVVGAVGGGIDSFDYTGDITSFSIDGPAAVFVDEQEVDPTTLGGSSDSTGDSTDSSTDSTSDTASTVEVISTENPSELTYEFTATGEVTKILNDTRNSAEENNDDISQNSDGTWSVQGYTGNGYGDSYTVKGELTEFSPATGPVKLVVDGQEVDPATLGDDGSSQTVETVSKLTIDGMGTDELAHYRFSVSGTVKQIDDPGEDNVNNQKVRGATRRGIDEFEFTGQITSFAIKGPARVYLDDTVVDPDTLG